VIESSSSHQYHERGVLPSEKLATTAANLLLWPAIRPAQIDPIAGRKLYRGGKTLLNDRAARSATFCPTTGQTQSIQLSATWAACLAHRDGFIRQTNECCAAWTAAFVRNGKQTIACIDLIDTYSSVQSKHLQELLSLPQSTTPNNAKVFSC
jgi:hypothetical protein